VDGITDLFVDDDHSVLIVVEDVETLARIDRLYKGWVRRRRFDCPMPDSAW
jgi:hypothetical protein